MSDLVRVDLGCGNSKQDGYIGVDKESLPEVDIVHDLETYPWPFESDSIDQINCANFYEHIKDAIPFMNELYRVLKVGGNCLITSPYYTSIRAWQDPTHVRAVSEQSFLYFNKGWREKEHLTQMGITCDFDFSFGYFFDESWKSRSEEAKQFALRHYMNAVTDVQILLVKK